MDEAPGASTCTFRGGQKAGIANLSFLAGDDLAKFLLSGRRAYPRAQASFSTLLKIRTQPRM
jgi:hypothetical protein